MRRPARPRWLRAALLAAAQLAAGRADAQEPVPPRDVPAFRAACAGRTMRVTTTAGEQVQGRCGPVEDARLIVLDDGGAAREVPYGTVEKVEVRGSGARAGGRAGALIGGVAAGTWTYLALGTLCDDASGCGGETAAGALVGAAIGSLAGAGVGTLLGATTRVWERIQP